MFDQCKQLCKATLSYSLHESSPTRLLTAAFSLAKGSNTMLAMTPAMTPTWGLESSTVHLLLSTSLLLCCILCMSCLILVIVTIRLVIPFRGASLLNLHQEPKADPAVSTDSKSTIKGLADPLHKLIQAVHNHFTSQPASQPASQSTSQPTTPDSTNPSSFKMTDTLQVLPFAFSILYPHC